MDVRFFLKEPGEPTEGIDRLMKAHWTVNPAFHRYYTYAGWLATIRELIESNYRAEGFLVGTSGQAFAATIWMPVLDPHYGEVAYPIAHTVDPFWRGNVEVLRSVSKLRRDCVLHLGVDRYLDVKHISDCEQRQRLRSINE